MTAAATFVSPESSTKKKLISSVRVMLAKNTGPSARKSRPKNKKIGDHLYTNISDYDVRTDHSDFAEYPRCDDVIETDEKDCSHQTPSCSEELAVALRGVGEDIIEPWLVEEEQSSRYLSSADGVDVLSMMSFFSL
mmetsp:Transcript_27035/g.39557  ORF Transcript_27035/g.39557 Transcript_27035/m.39557 type:complete len:136 (+) Transcript_27035:345-752(+)